MQTWIAAFIRAGFALWRMLPQFVKVWIQSRALKIGARIIQNVIFKEYKKMAEPENIPISNEAAATLAATNPEPEPAKESSAGQQSAPGASAPPVDVEGAVLMIENILNEYLGSPKFPAGMKFTDAQIKAHSELTAVVIRKHIPENFLKNSPEIMLVGLTAAMILEKRSEIQKMRNG